MRYLRPTLAAAAVSLFLGTAACGGDDEARTVEAETPVSEAEISTELPQDAVSDQQLQATANAAADQAASVPSAGPGPESNQLDGMDGQNNVTAPGQ